MIRSEQVFPGSVGVIRLTDSEAADGIGGDADIFEEEDSGSIHLAAESGEGDERWEWTEEWLANREKDKFIRYVD